MNDLTPLHIELLVALRQSNTRLRWHAQTHPDRTLTGRGLVMGTGGQHRGEHFKGGPIASYTVRKLVQQGMVRPVDKANGRPFSSGGPPYRDYAITKEGTAAIRGIV